MNMDRHNEHGLVSYQPAGDRELPVGPVKVRATWFRIMDDWVHRGGISTIGTTALAVYTTIKSYADFHTGISTVTQAHIARLIGKDRSTVVRQIKVLLAHELIRYPEGDQASRSRDRSYIVVEHLLARSAETGQLAGRFSWDYAPYKSNVTDKELRLLCEEGKPGRRVRFSQRLRITEVEESYELFPDDEPPVDI